MVSKVKTVVDVRLHNTSQLAGFAKSEDLAYFLKKDWRYSICSSATSCAYGRHAQVL
ncbi:DUF488 domain-containing protein [Sphingomonas sp. H160509]|nr:DUF488 domain-containing protein [Sphingomonas sp. H160509]MDD1449781.1 DUF488 domain-containing protein [Sphingomonas sp. H160509]